MTGKRQTGKGIQLSTRRLAIVLLVLCLGGLLALSLLRHSWTTIWGDEGTYIAMTESLALDGDLLFDASDRQRLEAAPEGGRQSVILQQTGKGITF